MFKYYYQCTLDFLLYQFIIICFHINLIYQFYCFSKNNFYSQVLVVVQHLIVLLAERNGTLFSTKYSTIFTLFNYILNYLFVNCPLLMVRLIFMVIVRLCYLMPLSPDFHYTFSLILLFSRIFLFPAGILERSSKTLPRL